ncbi:MAG: hypothetical protein LBI40_03375 [Treponema sp.]|jgi:hypothetical protein|nr:hypothetical protein [Treponema sp.]
MVNKIKFSQIMKIVRIMSFLLGCLILTSCNPYGKGDKILIIDIKGESNFGEDDVSEVGLIKEALEKGGALTLDVAVLRTIDSEFDSKFTASNSEGNFRIRPAILNFVGGQGWHLLQIFGLPGAPQYIFVKAR